MKNNILLIPIILSLFLTASKCGCPDTDDDSFFITLFVDNFSDETIYARTMVGEDLLPQQMLEEDLEEYKISPHKNMRIIKKVTYEDFVNVYVMSERIVSKYFNHEIIAVEFDTVFTYSGRDERFEFKKQVE